MWQTFNMMVELEWSCLKLKGFYAVFGGGRCNQAINRNSKDVEEGLPCILFTNHILHLPGVVMANKSRHVQ